MGGIEGMGGIGGRGGKAGCCAKTSSALKREAVSVKNIRMVIL
jgi:hypothetical protein